MVRTRSSIKIKEFFVKYKTITWRLCETFHLAFTLTVIIMIIVESNVKMNYKHAYKFCVT